MDGFWNKNIFIYLYFYDLNALLWYSTRNNVFLNQVISMISYYALVFFFL